MKFRLLFILAAFNILHAGHAQNFIVEKLPASINSPYDEITPVPSRDGTTLFFTRVAHPDFVKTFFVDSVDYAKKLTPERYNQFLSGIYNSLGSAPAGGLYRSLFNQDVWMATGDSAGVFNTISHPGYPLNNALPNSVVSITPDPNTFYILNQFAPNGDMDKGFSTIKATSDSLGWSFPKPVTIDDFYTITSDVSLTMSFDGKVLILSAVRFDSRDMDLYVCFKNGPNQWSAPQHLGNKINSNRRETTPFLSEDNQTLFFSSNRWQTSGGNDIFMSKREGDSWTEWSEPQRLTEPINSVSDDSRPYFNMTTGYLYFTSRRDGNSDIFRVQIAPPQPTELVVKGRVINRKTSELLPGASVWYGPADGSSNQIQAKDGSFSLKIPKGVAFNLTGEHPGFVGKPVDVLFRRDYYYFREQYVDLYLDPLEVDAQIELRPIFFQQSKAILLESSYDELERLATMLKENPGMGIRVEGHTDNIGREEDLQRLSNARAAAIRDFLMEKGIDGARVEAVGIGAARPLNDNSTDELRAKNRRVEVRVTKL